MYIINEGKVATINVVHKFLQSLSDKEINDIRQSAMKYLLKFSDYGWIKSSGFRIDDLKKISLWYI